MSNNIKGLQYQEEFAYHEGFRAGYLKGCEKALELLVEAKSLQPPAPIMICAKCGKSLEAIDEKKNAPRI